MAIIFDKDKAYMETLKAFRRLINTEYQEGGWLPPSREMCEHLNVSSVTYIKATNRLVTESVAESFPRKGIYIIPEKYRIKKIGIVVGGGEESPFLGVGILLASILRKVEEMGFYSHLIQGSPVVNIPRSAMSHCISGLIWISPSNAALSVIKEICASKLLPLIVVTCIDPTSDTDILPGTVPCVTEDYQDMATKISELFIQARHKNIVYAGNKWFAEYSGLASHLRDAGFPFDSDCCLGNRVLKPGLLTKLIKKRKITGLIIEGQAKRQEAIFQELSELPEDKQPELLVRACPILTDLYQKYPLIKLLGIADTNFKKCGSISAVNLINHIRTGAKLRSAKVLTYEISKNIDNIYEKKK